MNISLLLSTFIVNFIVCTSSLKILGLFPHAGKSHFDAFEPLLKKLASQGHDLTVVSHFPQRTQLPRYKDIDISIKNEVYVEFIPLPGIPNNRLKYYMSILMLNAMAKESCSLLNTEKIRALAKSKEKFDLILIEMFNTDCFLGFAHKFQVPFIGLSSCTIMPWSDLRFATPFNPAYIPMQFSQFADDLGFWERLENTGMFLWANLYYYFVMGGVSRSAAVDFFGGDLPDLEDVARNASLLLVNAHFTLNRPKPLVPNIVEVGGMFLPEKHRALPKVRILSYK